jgi:acetyl esterase/lipase
VGTAVINYRLQPATDWRGQVADVRQAVGWLHEHAREHGGRPDRMILYAGGESRKPHRQAQCLAQALERAGIEQSVVVVPGESHARMVLTLSRPDKTSVPAILAFIRTHDRTHGG